MKKLAKFCNAASEIRFDKMPVEKKKFIKKYEIKPYKLFDGIHGFVVFTDENTRLMKDDLKKMINDPDFRWIDISAIGF